MKAAKISNTLTIKKVKQAKINWCWSACAKMASKVQWVSYSYFLDGYGGRRYDHTVYTYFGSID